MSIGDFWGRVVAVVLGVVAVMHAAEGTVRGILEAQAERERLEIRLIASELRAVLLRRTDNTEGE